MKITKKEIAESTTCTRGSGFNPSWKYEAQINGIRFEKGFTDILAYVDLRTYQLPIGEASNKSEFINRVRTYFNKHII